MVTSEFQNVIIFYIFTVHLLIDLSIYWLLIIYIYLHSFINLHFIIQSHRKIVCLF